MRLILAELRRALILFSRYPAEAVSRVLMLGLLFYGLFLSARSLVGPAAVPGASLDAAIVGYGLWSIVVFALNSIAWSVQIEAQTGTLEQVCLAPPGPLRILLARAVAELGIHLTLNAGVLAVILLLTGRRLHFSWTGFAPLISVLLAVWGLGLALGGLVLLFRRAQHLLGLVQFLLLLWFVAPAVRPAWWWSLLPMSPGVALLRADLAEGVAPGWPALGLALANGLAYLALGCAAFRWSDVRARAKGLLGTV